MSLNKDSCILIQIFLPFFIISGENNNFYCSHQIFQGKKRHDLVSFCIFDCFIRDHSAYDHFLTVCDPWDPAFFIRLEIRCFCRDHFFHHTAVTLQRMSAEVNTKNLLFIRKQGILIIFSHIRHTDLKIFFYILFRKVKKAHLSGNGILFVLGNTVHDLCVNGHFLSSVAFQTVNCSCFDKILYSPFIHNSCQPLDKILQRQIRASVFTFLHKSLDHRPSHAFDGRKSITDCSIIHGKSIDTAVYIRRKNPDIHLAAYLNILRNLIRHFYYRRHKRRHKFYWIIILQISSLIGNHSISCRMRFIKRIFCKIDHVIINLIGYFFRDPICNTARNSFLLISVHKILPLFFHNRSLFL